MILEISVYILIHLIQGGDLNERHSGNFLLKDLILDKVVVGRESIFRCDYASV